MFPEREAALACLSNEWVHWQEKDKGWGQGQNLCLTLIEEMSQSLLTKGLGGRRGIVVIQCPPTSSKGGRNTHTHAHIYAHTHAHMHAHEHTLTHMHKTHTSTHTLRP